MDDKTFLDYITNDINLDSTLENENSSINIDEVIKGNLIVIREIVSDDYATPVSKVLNYIETKIENLIRSEEEEVEMLDATSFLIRLERDIELYSEKPAPEDSLVELLQISQKVKNEMNNQSWDAMFNFSLDENGNRFMKNMDDVMNWVNASNSVSHEIITPSSEKKIVRFDLSLNQVRNISPPHSEISTRELGSNVRSVKEETNNQHFITQYNTSLNSTINANKCDPQNETSCIKIEMDMDSIEMTNSFNDTKEYVEMGCSPITIEPIVMQSIGTITENVVPLTKSIGTSPIKMFVQSEEPNFNKLVDQKFRYLIPIINRTIFSRTKKYFNFFLKKNKLVKVSRVSGVRSIGTNTKHTAKKSQKVQTEENQTGRRKSSRLNKNQPTLSEMFRQTVNDVLQKKAFKSTKENVKCCRMNKKDKPKYNSCKGVAPLNTHKEVISTQTTLSQIFKKPFKAELQQISPTDESLSLIRDYRDPNDKGIGLIDLDATSSQLKVESPDYKSKSPLKIGDSIQKMEVLTISENKKSRRKLYTKSDFPDNCINSTPIKRKQNEPSRVPLEPKIIVLNPIEQFKHHIDVINTTPHNKLDDMFKQKGLDDRLVRMLMSPIEYAPHVSYSLNPETRTYEALDFEIDKTYNISIVQEGIKKPEFVTSSQMKSNNEFAFIPSSFSPIQRIVL